LIQQFFQFVSLTDPKSDEISEEFVNAEADLLRLERLGLTCPRKTRPGKTGVLS
jgi:hypothetical protein